MTVQVRWQPLGRMALAAFAFLAMTGAMGQVPVEAFFQNPAFSGGKLSPNARHVAMGVAPRDGRTQLYVIDVEKLTAKLVAGFKDADVGDFDWVNDDRLVFNVVDRQVGIGDKFDYPGVQAVSRDGSDFYEVITRRARAWVVSGTRHKTSDDVFIAVGRDPASMARYNTRTGKVSSMARSFGRISQWVLDPKDRLTVRVVGEPGSETVVQHFDDKAGKWVTLGPYGRHAADGFVPLAFAPDGNFYVLARNGNDKEALYRYDLDKKSTDPEPLVSVAGFDFDGELVMDKDRLLGVRYLSDAEATHWIDPELRQVQKKIDALLPTTTNQLEVPLRGEIPYLVVRAFSDVDPGNFYLYNMQSGKLTHLGAAMRGIDPGRMARKDFVRFKARDGLEIPAWLTLPRGSNGKNLPLVVLVHGGPWVRGASWRWDADSQFLASRGYAVLEPEFRGSMGFGLKHYQAGWKQWGLAMQDDVADGARWAVAQGIADGKRICIAGASYGGYSALMGLVNDPDLYRCGISWMGVTDIEMMYSIFWSDFTDGYKTHDMPVLIGDREKYAAQFKATSPLQQAARVRQPVFLAHGGADRRVPIDHSIDFRNAVRKHNPDVEWVEYLEEGHGWGLVKNRVDFWTRVEKFLERNIGAK